MAKTQFSRWFAFTAQERLLMLSVLAIVLIGLAAREWHARRVAARPYVPPGLEMEAP